MHGDPNWRTKIVIVKNQGWMKCACRSPVPIPRIVRSDLFDQFRNISSKMFDMIHLTLRTLNQRHISTGTFNSQNKLKWPPIVQRLNHKKRDCDVFVKLFCQHATLRVSWMILNALCSWWGYVGVWDVEEGFKWLEVDVFSCRKRWTVKEYSCIWDSIYIGGTCFLFNIISPEQSRKASGWLTSNYNRGCSWK